MSEFHEERLKRPLFLELHGKTVLNKPQGG